MSDDITEDKINGPITKENVDLVQQRAIEATQEAKRLKKEKFKQDIEQYFHDAFVNKHGVIVWLISSIVWFFIAFGTFYRYTKLYTVELVKTAYENELKKELEKPLIKANEEAAKIISDAKKKAQKIIDMANAEADSSDLE